MNKKFHQGQRVPFGAPSEKKVKVGGVKWPHFLFVLGLGILMWFVPAPKGVTDQAWHLFGIFFATIVGLIVRPMPMGAVAFLGLLSAILTNVLTLQEGLMGFANAQIWLIVLACFLARGVIKTGLGKRIAYIFLALFWTQ